MNYCFKKSSFNTSVTASGSRISWLTNWFTNWKAHGLANLEMANTKGVTSLKLSLHGSSLLFYHFCLLVLINSLSKSTNMSKYHSEESLHIAEILCHGKWIWRWTEEQFHGSWHIWPYSGPTELHWSNARRKAGLPFTVKLAITSNNDQVEPQQWRKQLRIVYYSTERDSLQPVRKEVPFTWNNDVSVTLEALQDGTTHLIFFQVDH